MGQDSSSQNGGSRRIRTTLRILLGIAMIGLLLGVASWAVRDCPVAPYLYENCIWLAVRDRFHLPQSKLLRAAVLEVVGLTLLAGLCLTCRYVLPWSGGTKHGAAVDSSGT